MPLTTAYTWAAPEAVPSAWLGWLHPEERAELGQGRPVAECERRLATRALLRGLLGRTLGSAAARAPIRRQASGALACDAVPGLSVNVSHTRGLVAAALSLEARVGIDVEALDRRVDHAAVAARFFHPLENAALARLPPAQQAQGFLALWTGKEAVAKALGLGLETELPLRAFALCGDGADSRTARWTVTGLDGLRTAQALPAPTGFAAALALAGGQGLPGPADFIPACHAD